MSHMSPCKLLVVAVLLFPMSVLAQSGGGGGGSGGGSAGGSSAGGASVGATGAAPSVGAGTAAVSRVTGPGNVGGLNNSGNDPSGAAKAPNTPGTNSAGTGQPIRRDQRPPLGVPHCDRQRSEQRATLLAERQEAASTAPLLRDLRGRATTRFGRKIPAIPKSIKRSKASAKDADCRKTCAQRMKSPVVIVLDVESPQLAMVAANN
jgi:hypothetical protein